MDPKQFGFRYQEQEQEPEPEPEPEPETYFEDFDVLGGEKSVILIDFRLFCNVLATPTNRASGALRDGSSYATSGASILFIKLTYF